MLLDDLGPAHAVGQSGLATFLAWIEQPHVKWAVPLPLLLALAPLVWLFFRSTWRDLDREALAYRQELDAQGRTDFRPIVALCLVAVVLTLQEYYGGRQTYHDIIRPWIAAREAKVPQGFWNLGRWDELYALSWWTSTRVTGYLAPLAAWKIIFPRDRLLDFGLRTKGFLEHAWIYSLFVVVMIPVMILVARQPDFGTYYPFYRQAPRSWLDFGMWEAMYVAQFFALEVFFRGFWVRACRSFGAGAIFAMVVPYCMIHYGKPYLEACGAIVAGTVLGSLSMKTRSIYSGFLVHITVAILMDSLALHRRNALPTRWLPNGHAVFNFRHLMWVFFAVWLVALLVLLWKVVRSWPELRRKMMRDSTTHA